jgi:hypothetical protein
VKVFDHKNKERICAFHATVIFAIAIRKILSMLANLFMVTAHNPLIFDQAQDRDATT